MLRVTQAAGAAAAKNYFTESLDRGDYYLDGQELAGRWGGKTASELGLEGEVGRKEFFALCENRHPQNGGALTLRTKTNRRVGYDFNFHCPKDVSVAYALTGDADILNAFTDAVSSTMADLESDMQCRVRKGGAQEDRTTGNLAWSLFVHQTARPVGGVPDPHLHAHCFTFNVTKDPEEGVWKAGQFGNIKRDAGYYEAIFHNRLRRGLEEAGYRTRESGKFFELEGAPDALRTAFSRRTEQIEAEAARKGILDPRRKGELGARTRDAKEKGALMSDLREGWLARLTPEERDCLLRLKGDPRAGGQGAREHAQRAADFARDHAFERESVVSEKAYQALAIRKAGSGASVDDVRAALAKQDLLRTVVDSRPLVTTAEVLAEEKAMVRFAKEGIGTCAPFARGDSRLPEQLSTAQRVAAEATLASRDTVTIIRGGAGTGKTYMMKGVVGEIERHGKKVFPVAPTTDAAHDVLRGDGFKNAETVQRLLVDKKLQSQLSGQVLWVDEAGLLGTRTMARLFDVARERNVRLLLTGDDRQHGAVERGGPFALLRKAGVRSVQLSAIRRQQGEYKRIVSRISRGEYSRAFGELKAIGWVKEQPQQEAHAAIAREVRAAAERGIKSPLVIAPTHREKDKLTDTIRAELRAAKKLVGKDRTYTRYESLNFTEAERRERRSYEVGQVLRFNKRATGFKAGQKTEVVRKDEQGDVWVRSEVGESKLRLHEADRFEVYRELEISIAAGDKLRITRNGKTKGGAHALRNGASYTVEGFDRESGDILLANGWVVPRGFGHIDHGYVETSFGTQGKTADRVLVAQAAESFGASNAEQFYVSVSRGKTAVHVYTDDAAELAKRIEKAEGMRNVSDAVGEKDSRSLAERIRTEVNAHEQRRRREKEDRERSI